MKYLLFALLCFASVNTKAQNGGQSPENEMIRLENYQGGIKVTNKQVCEVEFKTNQTENFYLASYSDTVIYGPIGKFKVKPLDKCQNGDMGWVEIDVNSSLPVIFKSIEVNRNMLSFTVGTENNVKKYIAQGSNNLKDWEDITNIKASGAQKYSIPLRSSVYLFLPLFFIGFIRLKNRFLLLTLIISALLFSCDKSSVVPEKENYRYYRVVAVDYDGNQTFSNIVK